MNIGVNARVLVSDKMEGISRYIYETTCAMAAAHPEDTFFMFFDRSTGIEFGFPPNVRCVVVPWHARHPVLWYWWFEIALPLYFRWYKIDVFYSGEAYLSLRSKVPTVMVIHDLAYLHYPEHVPDTSLGYFRKYVPAYIRRADSLITVSEYVKNDLSHQFGVLPEKIHVAGNAVKTDIRPGGQEGAVYGKPYFLYVGALQPRKNIVHLVRAFSQFNDRNNRRYRLVLAGRMAWKTDEIRNAILGNPDVTYAGPVSESEKKALIKGALCVTYVSLFEGFGIPILEAMSLGTPVITSSVTSMPEVAGNAALLADPHNIGQLAEAMERIAGDPGLREELITRGYVRCGMYSWQTSGEVIYKQLNQLAKKQAAG